MGPDEMAYWPRMASVLICSHFTVSLIYQWPPNDKACSLNLYMCFVPEYIPPARCVAQNGQIHDFGGIAYKVSFAGFFSTDPKQEKAPIVAIGHIPFKSMESIVTVLGAFSTV